MVKIAIKEDTNNNPFKISSTSSLALLLDLTFLNAYEVEKTKTEANKAILEL